MARDSLLHRITRTIAASSTVLLVVTVLLSLASHVLNPQKHYLSISDSFHASVLARDVLDVRIVLFNDADYGPYRGSTIQVSGSDGIGEPQLMHERRWGDAWGIDYRDFAWSDSRLWTLQVSLWYAIVLFSAMPGYWIRRRKSDSLATK